ncbi:hypothetical protein [Deinococcus yunweiensis]|uniref:hypothetical protein n=1 Tax=Deinococcus yunweiensis TaxID=367282 RepID=UPI00398E7A2E
MISAPLAKLLRTLVLLTVQPEARQSGAPAHRQVLLHLPVHRQRQRLGVLRAQAGEFAQHGAPHPHHGTVTVTVQKG